MMMPRPCPSVSRLLKTIFKFKKFVYNGKMTRGHFSIGQSWNSEISAILPCEIQSFNFDLWKNDQRSFFHYEPKVLDLKKVFSNLETERQGCGIIIWKLFKRGNYSRAETTIWGNLVCTYLLRAFINFRIAYYFFIRSYFPNCLIFFKYKAEKAYSLKTILGMC